MPEADDKKPGAHDSAAWESEGGAVTVSGDGGAATSGDGGAAHAAALPEAARDAVACAASPVEPLVLQGDIEASGRDVYQVEDLLRYHDWHFIENAHRALLGRAPFAAERARELDELRSGRASKVEIIERLLSSTEASGRRRVRVEGLPSPLMRRLSGVPGVGYVLRLARALVRLPLLMQHQQQFEVYALAQQQRIADHVNRVLALAAQANAAAATGDEASRPIPDSSQYEELVETVAMFSEALLDLSNSHAELSNGHADVSNGHIDLSKGHAELQAQLETQAEQVQAALTDLTGALTAQQEITETLRREQQVMADAQREFLIQEQRVIVETQKVVLEELRDELRALSRRQEDARAQLDAEVRRLQTLLDAATATATTRPNFSGQ